MKTKNIPQPIIHTLNKVQAEKDPDHQYCLTVFKQPTHRTADANKENLQIFHKNAGNKCLAGPLV